MWMSSRSRVESRSTESGGSQKRRRSEHSQKPGSTSGHSQSGGQPSQSKKSKLSASSFEDDVSDDECFVIELFSSDEHDKTSQSRSRKRSEISQDKRHIEKNIAENSQVSPINNNTSIFKKFKNRNERTSKEKAVTRDDSEPMFTQQEEDTDVPLLPWPKKVRKQSGRTSSAQSQKHVPSQPQDDSSSSEVETFASIVKKKTRRNFLSSDEENTNTNVSLENKKPLDVSLETSPVFKRLTEGYQHYLNKKSVNVSSDSFSDLVVVETSGDSGCEKKKKGDGTDTSDGFVSIGRGKHFMGRGTGRGTLYASGGRLEARQEREQSSSKTFCGLSVKEKAVELGKQKKKKTRKSFQLTSSSDESNLQETKVSDDDLSVHSTKVSDDDLSVHSTKVSDDDLSVHSTVSSDESMFAPTMPGRTQIRAKRKTRSTKSIRKTKDSAILSESDEDIELYSDYSSNARQEKRKCASQSNLFVSQNVREKLKQAVSGKFSSRAELKNNTPYKRVSASKESSDRQRLEDKKKPNEVAAVVPSDDEMTQPPDSYVDSQDDSEIFVIGLDDEANLPLEPAHQVDDDATQSPDLADDLPPALDLPQSSDDDATQPLELDPQPNNDLTQPLDEKSDEELTQPPSPSMFGDPPMLTQHPRTCSLTKNSVSLGPPELSLQQTRSHLMSMDRSVSEAREPPQLSEQVSGLEVPSAVSPASTIAHDSDSPHSNNTETFPDLDENTNKESVKALKRISCRSGGSTDSSASQSCLTFKPIIILDDGTFEHGEKKNDISTSEKLQSSNKENTVQTESKSNFASRKSVAFDLDIPIDVKEIKKEPLSEVSQTFKGVKAPCYTQEEDVIFVYDSSDDEAMLDLSQTNIRSDHLSDDMLDLFDHSDTELFDDDFSHDKTVPGDDRSSTLEELAQEDKNPFDHLGESDSDEALVTEQQSHLHKKSKAKKVLEISSDTDKDEVMKSPHSAFETSGHESCDPDMSEDVYFEGADMGELLDPTESHAKVADVFAEAQAKEVPKRDTDILNESTEVTTTEQSDATADEIQPRKSAPASRKTKRLNSGSSSVSDKKVKLREEECVETTSDEDLYLAVTQMDSSVVSLLRQNTFGEPEEEPKTKTDTNSGINRTPSLTPIQAKPRRKTTSVKKLNSSLKSNLKSSTVGKFVSFSSGAFDADTQLDYSTSSAQKPLSTSTPKVTKDKPKTSLFQMKKLSFQDLYSAQTQVMPETSRKSAESVDESLDDDADDDALCSALDDLDETCLTSPDGKQTAHSSNIDDPYLAATQVMSDVVVTCVDSDADEDEDEDEDAGVYGACTQVGGRASLSPRRSSGGGEQELDMYGAATQVMSDVFVTCVDSDADEDEDAGVYGACTQVGGRASPSPRSSSRGGEQELDMYGAATQVDPTLAREDVINMDDDQGEEMRDELDPFDVMTQVDEPELTSKSDVPASLLKRIKSSHVQKKSIMVAAERLKKKSEVLKENKKDDENSTTKQSATSGMDKSKFYLTPKEKSSWLSKKKSPPVSVKQSTAAGRRQRKQVSDNSFSLTQKIQAAKARQKERKHKSLVDPSVPIAKMKPAATAQHTSNTDVVLPDEDEIMAKGLPLLTFSKLVPKHKDEKKRQPEAGDSEKLEEPQDKNIEVVSEEKKNTNSSHLSKHPDEKHKSSSSKSHSSKSSSHSSKSSSHSSKSSSHSSKSSSHSSKSSSHSSSSGKSRHSSAPSQSRPASDAKKVSSSHSSSHSSKSSHGSKSHHHSSRSSGSQKKDRSSRHASEPTTPKTTPSSSALPFTSQPATARTASPSPNPVSVESSRSFGNSSCASPEKESILDVLAREVTSPEVTKSSMRDKSFDLSLYPLPARAKATPSPLVESGNSGAGCQDAGTAKDGDVSQKTDKHSATPRLVTPPPTLMNSEKMAGVKEPRKAILLNTVGPSKSVASASTKVPSGNSESRENRDPRLRASPVSFQRPNLLLKPSAAVRPVASGPSLMQKPAGPSRGHEAILPFSQVLRGAPATASTSQGSVANVGSKVVQEPAKLLDSTYYLSRVLQWNPIWLHEQMKPEFANHPPPVLQPEESVYPLLESYTSLEDYQNIMTRLLLLETWDTIFKEWKQKKIRRLDNITFISFDILNKQDKSSLGKFVWQGLLSREQMRRGLYPVEGELVIMNVWGVPLPAHKEVKPAWKATFGYVERINIRPATNVHNLLRTYPILKSTVEDPRGELHLMTITALARYRKYRPIGDKVMSIEPLCQLVTARRQFQALTYLPRSPLLRDILHPSSPRTFHHSTLIQDKGLLRSYNLSQAEAISAVCRAVQEPRHVPRICLLQGPPGTGKTHTITGIITKIIQDSKGKCCICLCTPSNGAADELTRRLIAIRKGGGRNAGMRLVRFGKTKSMHDDVVECAYDELLEKERAKLEQKHLNDLSSLPESVKREQQQLRNKIDRLKQEVSSLSASTSKIQIDRRTADLRKLERELQYLDPQRTAPAARQQVRLTGSEEGRLRQRILEEAHVICGTLNSIGSARIMNILRTEKNRNHFTCTIIDEATQSTELDCLIPLQYGTSKLVLVGDPEQLPPTIISQRAKEMKFGLSLFERFYTYFKAREHNPVLMLKTQYRMDAAILTFPNLYVYDGLLNTDRSVADRTKNFPLHPYLVFNNEAGQETISTEGSVSNQSEACCVANLCHLITSRTKILPARIGVVCPYQSQKTLVTNSLSQKGLREVEVNTVDGFQGREKHIIIMSCVRARSTDGSIGFLSDRRRLNVALTRAKYALFVIGHLDSLKRGADWRALIDDAQRRNVVVNIPNMDQFTRLAACCFKTNSGTMPRH